MFEHNQQKAEKQRKIRIICIYRSIARIYTVHIHATMDIGVNFEEMENMNSKQQQQQQEQNSTTITPLLIFSKAAFNERQKK